MWFDSGRGLGCVLGLFLLASGCAPSARVEEDPVPESALEVEADEAVSSPAESRPARRPVPAEAGEASPTPTPRFDPNNPDWPLRFQELQEAYLERFEPPPPESTVDVFLEGGRELSGMLLERTENDILLATAAGELRLGMEMMQPRSQSRFFADRYAYFFARHHARQEYEAWRAAQEDTATVRPSSEVAVRPRNREGVEVDPLHAPRRVRRNAQPPVNEEPTGRVRQVEAYILRHAASPDSLRVHYWGRVQPHGDGFTVRVRYSLEGAAGFGLSNEDMIFFMYADGTVYQRAAYRGN